MLIRFLPAIGCLILFRTACWCAPVLQETWESGHTHEDAHGAHVLGCWTFDGPFPLFDATGKDSDLSLEGAVLNADGKFGQSLESFPGMPVENRRHAAMTQVSPLLSPQGAFSVEMWIRPHQPFKLELPCYLLDKKDADHADYQWQIGAANAAGARQMMVTLGFGEKSHTFHSLPVSLPAEVWQHVAFTYDAAGEVSFHLNGSPVGSAKVENCAAIAPGSKPLSIGDGLGAIPMGFPGQIDEVRLCDGVLNFAPLALQMASSRNVWQRMETALGETATCTNLRRELLTQAQLRIAYGGREEIILLPDLAPGASHTVKFNVNTTLRPGSYLLRAKLENGPRTVEQSSEFEIVPRLPPRMPVLISGGQIGDLARLRDIGFTHFVGLDNGPPPAGKLTQYEDNLRLLDAALAHDLRGAAALSPTADLSAQKFIVNYRYHSGLTALLLDSPSRSNAEAVFAPVDADNYRKFTNVDAPAGAVRKQGLDWSQLADFPADRVIPDDHPLLKYYRWFWREGDVWHGLHGAMIYGIKRRSYGRDDLWTFFDKALSQPGIGIAPDTGDALAHGADTYPDPKCVGLCADQLLAMSAANGREQKVMVTTDLAWDRSKTAPSGNPVQGFTNVWEGQYPDATVITVAPMHLREAFWSKIARPVHGIMFRGSSSLLGGVGGVGAQHHTNPDAAHVLKELLHEVVEPLGTSLMCIPDEPSEVVMLESFASQIFAGRGGYGKNHTWSADFWRAMQHAHVQTDILFEETLLYNGLSGRKILLLPECDVLTQGVVALIKQWQAKGGKIIADEFLCPALTADVTLPSSARVNDAREDKARILAMAETIPAQMETLGWTPQVSCDNPEIMVRTRRFGDALYVFVANDQREPGNYVGHHGLVLENGLPSSGMLTLHQDGANVYDLTRRSLLIPKRGPTGKPSWQVDLGPSDGRIFMVTTKPLLGIQLDVPEAATCGNIVSIKVTLTTTQDNPIQAVIPVEVQLRDTNGRPAEGCGYYAAENGSVTVSLDLAPNEDPGTWEIRVRELASGMQASKWMRVRR